MEATPNGRCKAVSRIAVAAANRCFVGGAGAAATRAIVASATDRPEIVPHAVEGVATWDPWAATAAPNRCTDDGDCFIEASSGFVRRVSADDVRRAPGQ